MRSMTSREKLYAIRFGGIMTIAGAVLILDRLSKAWIRHHFQLGESRPVTSWFYLTFVQNTGTAFGLFQGNNKALLILADFSALVLNCLFASLRKTRTYSCSSVTYAPAEVNF